MIGVTATMLSILSFCPVIYKIYNTKNTSNFTPLNIFLALVENVLWIAYGIINNSFANKVNGVILSCMYAYIAYTKFNTMKIEE